MQSPPRDPPADPAPPEPARARPRRRCRRIDAVGPALPGGGPVAVGPPAPAPVSALAAPGAVRAPRGRGGVHAHGPALGLGGVAAVGPRHPAGPRAAAARGGQGGDPRPSRPRRSPRGSRDPPARGPGCSRRPLRRAAVPGDPEAGAGALSRRPGFDHDHPVLCTGRQARGRGVAVPQTVFEAASRHRSLTLPPPFAVRPRTSFGFRSVRVADGRPSCALRPFPRVIMRREGG